MPPVLDATMVAQRGIAAVLAAVCAVVALAGCQPRRAEPPRAPQAATEAPAGRAAAVPEGAARYAVEPGQGRVTLRIYRSGPLARLGHNHVIESHAVSGQAWAGATPATSGFELRLPVDSFVVDDPAARRAAGAGFEAEVPEEARAGTRANLLRPEVLDAERHPELVVRARWLDGSWAALVAPAEVTVRGVTRRIDLPIELERDDRALRARGSFRLRQSDFGIVPFAVGGGALQVADEIEVSFDLRAQVQR
jgi:polyisoprenoid-binding protein YceI